MVFEALVWVLLVALVVYGAATVLASLKWVPEGHVGVLRGRGGVVRVVGNGLHVVNPLVGRVTLVPKGPVRMEGEVRDAVTRDGWRISAHFQLNSRLVDESVVTDAGEDWRRTTHDVAGRVLRTELENNDATDLRPRPLALDEVVIEEINVVTSRWGVEVDWLRVTIRWAYAVPPAHEVPRP